MKLFILCVLLTLPTLINAQLSAMIGTGWSTLNHPTAEIKMQYTYNNIIVNANMITHLSTVVKKGTLFNIQSGYKFQLNEKTKLEPTIGYSYNSKSTDNKSFNQKGIITSLYFNKKIIEDGDYFIGINLTSYKLYIISIGLRYNF